VKSATLTDRDRLMPTTVCRIRYAALNRRWEEGVLLDMTKTIGASLLILALASGLNAQSEFAPQTLLKPKFTGLYSVPPNLDARAGYEMLGDRAGINVVFYPGFKPETVVPLRVEGQTFFEVMDRFSDQTGNFWYAWDSKTVIVAQNTPSAHRDVDPLTLKIFYLGPSIKDEMVGEVAAALRSGLQLRGIYSTASAKAILVRDTASTMSAVERLIAELSPESLPLTTSAPLQYPENGTRFLSIAENGKVRRVLPSTESHMENMLAASVSLDMNQPPHAIYEDLALRAGMNVIVDREVRAKPASRFHVEKLDLVDALDLLALQTGTFWEPLNESTIHVMEDTPQNRRDRDRLQVKIIYLPSLAPAAMLMETANVLRTSLSLRGMYQDEKHKAIIIRDTPLRVFLAEKIISDLDKRFGQPTSVTLTTETNSIYAESNWILSNAAKARPQLELKLRSRTTIRMDETPRKTFEALAELAGLQLAENSSISDTAEVPFNLYNVDILDALDLFAWQTRHFWQVVDDHTIRVIPDSPKMRRDLEPIIEKTIYPADPTGVTGLLNVLRTAFQLRQIQLNDKDAFVIRDTTENVAVAERLIEILGSAAPPAP
jgi:hypothetical protein